VEPVAAPANGRPTMDDRGLVELNDTVPHVSEIQDGKATFDAKDLTTRQINLELRSLIYDQGIRDVTVQNPGARHSLENMMSGVVVIDGNAGSLTGAAMRGGDLLVRGRVGARTGIDQKGGTIIVCGDAGSNTAFMIQRGRQIILGNAGPGLGDSMYDGELYVAGKVKSLGVDCVPGEWTDADTELIERKFRIYGLGSPPEMQKFVCGKKLYNYDTLEPSERKLVL